MIYISILFANNPGDEKGGHIAVEAGKQVTVRLTPDYGYQLKGAIHSMEELRWHRRRRYPPSPSQCRIPTCILKESSHRHQDEINTTATKVSSASVENGANAAPSGNLRLTVE